MSIGSVDESLIIREINDAFVHEEHKYDEHEHS